MTDVVRSVTAPLMIGAAITTALLGLTLNQTFTYFATFPKDRTIYRLIVGTLIVLDVVQTVFSQLTLWRWFIQAPQDTVLGKTGIPWPFAFSPMLCGLTTAVVQTFYAYRVFVLSRRRMINPLIIVFGALVQLSWSTYATTQIIKIREFSRFHIHLRSIISWFWLGTAALTDCFLTVNLIYWLSNSKTQIHQTNSLLNSLILLAIETNCLTFAVAALDLILFICRSDSAHLAPNLCLGKLYSISLLISLNTRCRLGKNFGGQRSVLLDEPPDTHSEPHSINTKPLDCPLALNPWRSSRLYDFKNDLILSLHKIRYCARLHFWYGVVLIMYRYLVIKDIFWSRKNFKKAVKM